jgi:hypothetical protein
MPTTSHIARSAGAAVGQSAGLQHAQTEVSSEQTHVDPSIVQSPRPGEHADPFCGSVAGHICAPRRQFQVEVKFSISHVHEVEP